MTIKDVAPTCIDIHTVAFTSKMIRKTRDIMLLRGLVSCSAHTWLML